MENVQLSIEESERFSHAGRSAPYPADWDKVHDVTNGFVLIGHGDARDNCGEVYARVYCPDCGKYESYITQSCKRAVCPECYEKWLVRTKIRTRERLYAGIKLMKEQTGKYVKFTHTIWSPPVELRELGYEDLKKEFHKVRKFAGSVAGVVVFHPYRFRNDDGQEVAWKHCSLNPKAESPVVKAHVVYEPHFHTITTGFLMRADLFYEKTKWIYKNKGVIRNFDGLGGTIYYMLSHSAIVEVEDEKRGMTRSKYQAVMWFGKLSTNQFSCIESSTLDESVKCPECGGSLLREYLKETESRPKGDWVLHTIKVTERHFRFKEGVLDSLA